MDIFSTEAPKYWAKNLPAIPLQPRDKMPWINRWQIYADTMPSADEQANWLQTKCVGNIGMPMGPQSGLVAIDVDTDDDRVLAVLRSILPSSPWKRIGKKGFVEVFKFNGQRTFRIKGQDGSMIMECLSKGAQIVLPPSIHPQTMKPYVANCDLYDVLDQVPVMPKEIEAILRGALEEAGIQLSMSGFTKVATFVPAGARDNAMVSMCGILARAVTRAERSLLEALSEIEIWVENFTENVEGDPMSVDKAKLKIVEFLTRDVLGPQQMALPQGWDDGLSDEDKEKLGLTFDREHTQWSHEQIKDQLLSDMARHVDPESAGWMGAVENALARLVRSDDVTSIQEEQLLRFIIEASQRKIALSTLRRRIAELTRGEILGNDHTELAKETIKHLSQFGEIRHNAHRFWQWNGAHWSELEEGRILKVIADEFGKYPAAKKSPDHRGIMKVMGSLAEADLKTLNINGINFANGFLDEFGRLVPHSPDHGLTYVLPYRYVPEKAGHFPMFNQLIADAWGKDPDYQDKLEALQEAMASTMFGVAPRFQRAVLLMSGEGGTGKTTLARIIMGLMPDAAICTVPPHEWSDKFMPAQMHHKLMNFCGELSETDRIKGDKFKLIVEGTEISAQNKGQQIFRFKPTCANWFASNHLPKTGDSSDGFNRRWLILEFSRKVGEGTKVIDYDQIILAEEREAIAAWAVEGLKRLVENRDYTLPTSHMAAIDEMANDNNSVRHFLTGSSRIRVGEAAHQNLSLSETHITEVKLYEEYWSFCLGSAGVKPVTLKTFRARMKALGAPLGFKLQLSTTKSGMDQSVYEFITLVN